MSFSFARRAAACFSASCRRSSSILRRLKPMPDAGMIRPTVPAARDCAQLKEAANCGGLAFEPIIRPKRPIDRLQRPRDWTLQKLDRWHRWAGFSEVILYAAGGMAVFIGSNFHGRVALAILCTLGTFVVIYLCTIICAMFYEIARKALPASNSKPASTDFKPSQ
jgi:hypothetical protein